MVNNLVELLSQVHQIKVGSPHATHPSISIIFITATLGQHLHQHYPRLKPITPTPPSRTGFCRFSAALPFSIFFQQPISNSTTTLSNSKVQKLSLLHIFTLECELALEQSPHGPEVMLDCLQRLDKNANWKLLSSHHCLPEATISSFPTFLPPFLRYTHTLFAATTWVKSFLHLSTR